MTAYKLAEFLWDSKFLEAHRQFELGLIETDPTKIMVPELGEKITEMAPPIEPKIIKQLRELYDVNENSTIFKKAVEMLYPDERIAIAMLFKNYRRAMETYHANISMLVAAKNEQMLTKQLSLFNIQL